MNMLSKVQSNQTNFTSVVRFPAHYAAELNNKNRTTVLKQLEKLVNNGNDDKVVISHKMGSGYNTLSMWVFKKEGGKVFQNSDFCNSYVSNILAGYDSLGHMYQRATKSFKESDLPGKFYDYI